MRAYCVYYIILFQKNQCTELTIIMADFVEYLDILPKHYKRSAISYMSFSDFSQPRQGSVIDFP